MVAPHTPLVPNSSNDALAGAVRTNTLGVGFSGSGFLIFYFTGVTAVLKTLGIINNKTRLAGSSGGSAASILTCADVPAQRQYAQLLNMAAVCRPTGSCNGFLDKQVSKSLSEALPVDSARACSGRVWVSVTAAKPDGRPDVSVLLGGNWNSTQQMVSAVRGSSFIPFLSAPAATLQLPGFASIGSVYDGGFSQPLPCPPGVSYCIKVTPFPFDPKVPADREIKATLQDLNTKAKAGGMSADSSTAPYIPLNPIITPAPTPDIYAGISKPLPVDATTWSGYALNVPASTTLRSIYNIGCQDAAFWAVKRGLATPAQATKVVQAAFVQ